MVRSHHTSPAAARRLGSCGISFVETMAAVTLVAVASGLALMSVGPILHMTAGQTASQQLASDLRLTRMKAIARNQRFRVVFDTADGEYTIEREASPGNFVPDEGPFELPTAASLQTISPSDPIFDTRGAVSAPTTITISAPNTHTRTVTISILGTVTES
jgi:type II secretory pathway pseudopilin PulG